MSCQGSSISPKTAKPILHVFSKLLTFEFQELTLRICQPDTLYSFATMCEQLGVYWIADGVMQFSYLFLDQPLALT